MITIIRNDKFARFAHEVHGIKIKEEKPVYKIVATLENEGLCVFESPNYAEIAATFDIIVEAIMEGKPYVFLAPARAARAMSQEEFDNGIHDFCRYKEDERPIDKDLYGRELPKYKPEDIDYRDVLPPREDFDDFYAWQRNQRGTKPNNYMNNYPPKDTHEIL